MPIEILMPSLSPTMTEGKLSKWLVKEGDEINSGDVIAEIETDKATMELESIDEGRIGRILIPDGTDGVEVNSPIGILLEEGEEIDSLPNSIEGSKSDSKLDEADDTHSLTSNNKDKRTDKITTNEIQEKTPPPGSTQDERVLASPLAKRMAANAGIDLMLLHGSGPGGRIVKADIEQFIASKESQVINGTSLVSKNVLKKNGIENLNRTFSKIENSNIRKIIANRLTESKQTIPHFYLTIDCRIDKLLGIRKELNSHKSSKIKLSVNDFIIKAVATALVKMPSVNASWTDEAILQYDNVDISVAVATDNGLITPIIRNSDQKQLSQISIEMKDLADRARNNKLRPEEFQGGGFSISNLGMYGIKDFKAIINPPQSAILAVGSGEVRPAVVDGILTTATIMTCTLSCDHRVIDGSVGAEFLATLKPLLEDPLMLLM